MGATATRSSVGDALSAAVEALRAAGVESPRLDAELLLAEASGLARERLAAEPDAELPPGASRAFGAMVRRRLRREPVAYILGRKGFRHIELLVDSRVLSPRPETELLVELALELQPRTVLEAGTGSGAVALAVADELPGATVTATDISAAALEVARANAERLGLADRVSFVEGSVPDGGSFDLVLANLPYVPDAEWERLPPEIRDHEPREAVVGGHTGLEAMADVLRSLWLRGVESGTIAIEVGVAQSRPVADLVRAAGFGEIEMRHDLAGFERVVLGRRV